MERALGFLESKSEANKIIQAVKDQKLPKLERFPEGPPNRGADLH